MLGLRKLLAAGCGLLAALALFAIMALTLVDVSGRKFLSSSVPGSLELTELLLVVVIFAALPLVSLRGEHIVFDSLDAYLPPWLHRVQQIIIDGLCAAGLFGIAWLVWVKAGHMADYGDTTAQLQLPLSPFVHLMSALCAAAGLVHLMLMLTPAPEHVAPEASV